ncbi:MAG: hypothetical protein FWE40_07550 [Oscillospiraceae bacterium]|nr:hypothetical protein [Oscillospiraceae bacterium]
MMNQYELQLDFQGDTLRLPEQFRNRRGIAKIILITDDVIEPIKRKRPTFTAFNLDTTGFKFNREEANER